MKMKSSLLSKSKVKAETYNFIYVPEIPGRKQVTVFFADVAGFTFFS